MVLLLVLGGCAAKATTTAAAPPKAMSPEKPPAAVSAWKVSPPTIEAPVRAAAWEELPLGDPAGLVRDLADAKACVAVRSELALLVVTGLARVRPPVSAKASGQVRSGIERTAVPGCAIARRECGDDGTSRRWCWSEAFLDSSVARSGARRELVRLDSARVERFLAEVFRSHP